MNDEQIDIWNGRSGNAWVDLQPVLDRAFQAIEELLVASVPVGSPCRVLDVGCGTGATTLAVAGRLGVGGRALGVDLSPPMTEAARARAERAGSLASFVCADAQTYAFEAASFDVILSRFGVMFFDDPTEAFANLRRAARADGELCFVVWRSPEENPFMTTAERAAAPLLSNIPARKPHAPGQFAFADAGRVRTILEQSGWGGIEIDAIDVACALPESELGRYVTRFGPLGRVLHEVPEGERAPLVEAVRRAFDPYVHGAEVRFDAACWRVRARAPG